MIDKKRLEAQFSHLAKITAPGRGINRLAFTDADWEGRSYIISLMKDAHLEIRQDAFGNVIGTRRGKYDELPAVMCGSHADSVPDGGNFDGIVGILSAVEAAKRMDEEGFANERTLEVVLFMNEESSRFGSATLGSKAMRGLLPENDLTRLKDKSGVTLYDALKSRDLDPDGLKSAVYKRPLCAFLEIHIEQGKVLEHEKIPVGVVTGIAAPTRMRVKFIGSADHSGATPMGMRKDALCAASELILFIESAAASQKEPPVVGTVGVIDIKPGALNVIPGEATLGIDIRSIDAAAKQNVADLTRKKAREIASRRGIDIQIEELNDDPPVALSKNMVDFLSSMCEKSGVPYIRMPSGAGHDSMHWADYAPTGMLFLPCRGGISHNPAEYASLDDIATAANVLEAALRELTRKDKDLR